MMASLKAALRETSQTQPSPVTEVPKIDLETYIQNYRGRTRMARLLHIANCSTVLGLDALKLVARDAAAFRDTELYRHTLDRIRAIDPNDSAAVYDKQWVQTTDKNNKAELIRLEAELRGYKNNLVKESIRMGNEDLAKHYESLGELSLAYDVYGKMRADASATKHIVEVGWHLARVSVLRCDWSMAISNVNKISGLHVENGDNKTVKALSSIHYGIGLLGQQYYTEAAQAFLRVDPGISPSLYDELASPNDIATYGGLLTLATMDRPGLSRFLEDSPFRPFLELEPHFRRAISQFVNGRYSACLAILESNRPDYLLDIYLHPHVTKLYSMIRSKCIFHFLQPFSCVTIESMNAAFASPGVSIEAELIDMIRNGGLQARIDPIENVITTAKTNPRAKMQAEALAATKQFEKDAVDRIRRIGIISADLEVKGKQKGSGRSSALRSGDGGHPSAFDAAVSGGSEGGGEFYDFPASSFVASQY